MTQKSDDADKLEAFNGRHAHENACESYCCPHCTDSAPQRGVTSEPSIVTCPFSECGKRFIAWTDEVTVHRSAELPA